MLLMQKFHQGMARDCRVSQSTSDNAMAASLTTTGNVESVEVARDLPSACGRQDELAQVCVSGLSQNCPVLLQFLRVRVANVMSGRQLAVVSVMWVLASVGSYTAHQHRRSANKKWKVPSSVDWFFPGELMFCESMI